MTAEHSLEKALNDLEWRPLLERIALGCASSIAARRLIDRMPAEEPEQAAELSARTAEAMAALEADRAIPAFAIDDVGELVDRLERGAIASTMELLGLLRLLRRAGELRRYVRTLGSDWPALRAALACPDLAPLEARLDEALDDDGEISDRASAALAQARGRATEGRRAILRKLDALVRRHSDLLRDRAPVERDGRYVLPVRADAPIRLDGIVLGSSASGSTLYIEPRELTELGNRFRMAVAEVERETARVLAELSDRVRGDLNAIRRSAEACIEADILSALARWGAGAAAIPLAPVADAVIDLKQMRHPLLLGGALGVIPNDLRLQGGRGLVLSGPNAGGKTVALKCVGLAVLMARAGIPIPADPGSTVGWHAAVLTDIGDEQSLSRSLSTFSAHITRLVTYLEASSPGTLLLLDEVAAGTDPEEGSALAVAVLEALVDRGAAVFVTTHYERLKELAADDGRFENASVGFDMAAMSPTFHVTQGRPGASSALAVASRYGMPDPVVARAKTLLPQESTRREALIGQLESDQIRMAEARRQAEAAAREQERLLAEIEAERSTAREREQKRLAEAARDLTAVVREARSQIREAQRRLKETAPTKSDLKEIERVVSEAAKHVAVGSALDATVRAEGLEKRSPAPVDALKPGAAVVLTGLGRSGTVVSSPERGQVRVAVGPLKLTVPVQEVRLDPRSAQSKSRSRNTSRAPSRATAAPARTGSNTFDARGLRVDEAMDGLERFIDRLLSEGESAGFVLHGHGTGALKAAIREQAPSLPYVQRVDPAEEADGGDAFTVLVLDG